MPALSRESSVKRSRGFSASSATAVGLAGLRAFGGASIRSQLSTAEDGLLANGSLDHTSFDSRAVPQRAHSRAASSATRTGLLRSPGSASPVAVSTSSSPQRVMPASQDLEEQLAFALDGAGAGPLNGSTLDAVTLASSSPLSRVASPESASGSERTVVAVTTNGTNGSSGHGTQRAASNNHTRSSSGRQIYKPQELNSVGEFAMEHLFTSFVSQADQKISECATSAGLLQPDPDIERLCGPGVDLTFDQLLSALAHVVRKEPKLLIDKVMKWRSKYDATHAGKPSKPADNTASPGDPRTGLPRTMSDPQSNTTNSYQTTSSKVPKYDPDQIATDRKSTIAKYLLCRALIEIIGQTSAVHMPPKLFDKLVDIIYRSQAKCAIVDDMAGSAMKRAQWSISSQLLGIMADLDFDAVGTRFLADLKMYHKDLCVKGVIVKESEGNAIIFMKAMRHLRLKTTSESWTKSCNFMLSLAELFAGVHGQPAKTAYCKLIGANLLSVAGKAATDFDHPVWKKFYHTLSDRLAQLSTKPKYWNTAFPVQAILTCVAPYDTFVSRWHPVLFSMQSKLRERNNRATVLKAICRLLWSYLHRTADSTTVVARHLDDVAKMVFSSGKKYSLSSESAVAEPLIQLIRIIGSHEQNICFKTIIFPLLSADVLVSSKELRKELLEPDRMVIGIRAVLAILNDLERHEHPPYPRSFIDDGNEDASITAMTGVPSEHTPNRKHFIKEDRLSKPVIISGFNDSAKQNYATFCSILGKIAIVCDNVFGGQAANDEKINTSTPKTPTVDWRFARRDDNVNSTDERVGFYNLLHVAVQALPRCLSSSTPVPPLVNLLCTGTSHPEHDIAISSAKSLKSIAQQGHAQTVVDRFSGFIFNYENRYGTMSDGGALGPEHIETTLTLYVELLQVWIGEIKEKAARAASQQFGDDKSGNRGVLFDTSNMWTQVDRVESQGLFFLCSPSSKIRTFAIEVLRLITQLDAALGQTNTRIMRLLEDNSPTIVDAKDKNLSVQERSRLQKGMRKIDGQSTLIEICTSNESHDIGLWNKLFPNLVRVCFKDCPMAVTQTKEDVCARLSQMHSKIEAIDDRRPLGRFSNTTPEMTIEQWKIYLIFVCITLTKTGGVQHIPPDTHHVRKSSKSSQTTQESFSTATDLFSRVIPMLATENQTVRDAAVVGLGSINKNLYKSLLDALDAIYREHAEDITRKAAISHARATSSPRRYRSDDYFRTELTHVYQLTAHFLALPEINKDVAIVKQVAAYIKELYHTLKGLENDQSDNHWDYQQMRIYYCGLVEGFFTGISTAPNPSEWMSFSERKATFILLEEWCGYSPITETVRSRSHTTSRPNHYGDRSHGSTGGETVAVAVKKKDLETASLNAMATLCRGPMTLDKAGGSSENFNFDRLLAWIDKLLNDVGDQRHAIGRRALKNVIAHNKQISFLLLRSIEAFYRAKSVKSLEGYVEVVSDVLMHENVPAPPFWKIASALLYTLGHKGHNIRTKSARLLRFLEDRQEKSSKLHDLDISISDSTTAVNKLAQFEISQRLATQHPELAFHIFSEVSAVFLSLQPDDQRSIVGAILPWIQVIELQLDPKGGPTASSYMLLVNLLEITVKCSTSLHHEVQALWKALATGPYAGNVQLILDFIIEIFLGRRDLSFVPYAKQIVVHLSTTQAGQRVIDFLLLQITPRSMVQQENRAQIRVPDEVKIFTYTADLTNFLPLGPKQSGLSLGHLCLVLLVDLIVSSVELAVEKVPSLLQVVLVLWDYHMEIVRQQAREMLVHLIHELVISRMDGIMLQTHMSTLEDFIELIRRDDQTVNWTYEEKSRLDSGYEVPSSMANVIKHVGASFSLNTPSIYSAWGRTAVDWAVTCPVPHLACRSLQIYRCIQKPMDARVVSDLLSRLGNTIADEDTACQAFAMDVIRTIRTMVGSELFCDVQLLCRLFWAIAACLDSVHEWEFAEGLEMLESFMDRFDLSDPVILARLLEAKPRQWHSTWDGIAFSIYKGCRSATCMHKSLSILNKLIMLPSHPVVGDDNRLLFVFLANLSHFMNSFEHVVDSKLPVKEIATDMAKVAASQGNAELAKLLADFAQSRYRDDKDFVFRSVGAIRPLFYPALELKSLAFLMGLLTNKIVWFKLEVLQILRVLVTEIDMQKPEIANQGPDLVSPLLRLLQTEFCPQALKVLDNMMTISGTPLDGYHLRMSMAGSQSSRAIRKEYERTQSHYGIPEESGWSVPTPAITQEATRRNIMEIYNAIIDAAPAGHNGAPTPDVEFYKGDYSYFQDPKSLPYMEDSTLVEANMSELVSRLDTLDDFFDSAEPESSINTETSHHTPPNNSSSTFRDVYDTQTPPGSSSHQQNASRNGMPRTRQMQPREPVIMSPSAFRASPKTQSRPSMHPRSVTSPATNQRTPPERSFYMRSDDTEPMSDDELSMGRTSTSDRPFAVDGTIRTISRSKGSFRSNVRSSIKRLTSGGDRHRAASRGMLEESPEVPKVPDVYLNNPKSAEL